jgi:tRNA dimethylallyltransferase
MSKTQIKNNKLLVILGPTASGKTDLSVKLAKKFSAKGGPPPEADAPREQASGWNGAEIVSADSRQVYKGLDIGSGKITKKEMQGVPHHLLDVANPKRKFSVSQYQRLALRQIKDIQKRGKLPILVGGTGFYIQSIVDGIVIPQVKPDWELRKKLEKFSLPELVEQLRAIDPNRAATIDQNNPRRVLRALEIATKLAGPVPAINTKKTDFNVLQIGVAKPKEELKKLIAKRLKKRLKNDAMIKEVKKLHNAGVSFKRLEELGIEYRFVAQYMQKKIAYREMVDKIQIESEHYAKRQMTWFKRDQKIIWIKSPKEALSLCRDWLSRG